LILLMRVGCFEGLSKEGSDPVTDRPSDGHVDMTARRRPSPKRRKPPFPGTGAFYDVGCGDPLGSGRLRQLRPVQNDDL
jgi:hypothetical protein